MSDLGWFLFRPRGRTAVVSKSPSPPERYVNHETDNRLRQRPNRVSSHIGLNSHSSYSQDSLTALSRASIIVNEEDKVWYNPSIGQMAEALQVIMMTNGVLQPLPVEYNSYILHLIEAFKDMQKRIGTANAARRHAEVACDRVSQDCATVVDEWAKREAQFKAEIKRLEVILARTSRDGLETVALARTNSLIDRGVPDAKQFVSRLQELRTQETHCDSLYNQQVTNGLDTFPARPSSTGSRVMKTLKSSDSSALVCDQRSAKFGRKSA